MENGFHLLELCQFEVLRMWTLMKETSMVTSSVILYKDACMVPILQPFNGINDRSVVVMNNASINSPS